MMHIKPSTLLKERSSNRVLTYEFWIEVEADKIKRENEAVGNAWGNTNTPQQAVAARVYLKELVLTEEGI